MTETGNCEWNERMTKAHSKLKQLIDVLSDMEHITNGFDEGRNLVENTPTAERKEETPLAKRNSTACVNVLWQSTQTNTLTQPTERN